MTFNRVKRDYFCLVLKLLAYFEANVDIILIPLDGVIHSSAPVTVRTVEEKQQVWNKIAGLLHIIVAGTY